MSKSNIKKNLADRLLKLASKEENDRIRKEAQSGRAQLVFVDSLEWLDTIILEMMSRIDANSQPQIKKRRFKRYNNKISSNGWKRLYLCPWLGLSWFTN